MQTYSPTASIPMAESSGERKSSRQTEDLVYQGVTIASMLLVLASLWIF